MKKKLISMLALTLSFVFFAGSGCASSNPLAFNNDFNGGGGSSAEPSNLIERLEYSVEYTDNYLDSIIKSDTITDELVKFKFENGSFVQELKVDGFIDQNITTDIEVQSNRIYHLTTTFNIDFLCDVGDGNGFKTFNDQIVSTVHFLSASNSFAPIYSTTSLKQTFLFLPTTEGEKAQAEQVTYQITTTYSKDEYVMVTTSESSSQEKVYDNSFKKCIDNAQLLFAVRNLGISEEANYMLPTVSTAYGEAKTLKINYAESSVMNTPENLSYNENTVSAQTIPVKNYNFLLNSEKNTGAMQFLKIQKQAVEGLPFKSLVLEYAETLPAYGTFSSLGALVYTLKSVTVS